MSGGGGWGAKQGLLSLDPETTLFNFASSKARYDFDSNDSKGNDQIQALGNIAKPGSSIQFYISEEAGASVPGNDAVPRPKAPRHHVVNSLAFGCIPSTIDDIPVASSISNMSGDEKRFLPGIHVIKGQFSAQSDSGIFISLKKGYRALSSKVDVPHSTVWCGKLEKQESNSPIGEEVKVKEVKVRRQRSRR